MLLILCTLLMMMTAVNYMALFKFRGVLDKVMTIFVITLVHIIGTVLITGVFGSLTISTLVFMTIIEFVISLIAIYVVKKRCTIILSAYKELFLDIKEINIKSKFVTILLFIVICQVIWLSILIYLFPPYAYDGLMYHLVSVADWIQNKQIGITPYIEWTNVYPQHGGLIYTWLVIFLNSDVIVEIGQLVFGIMGAIATIGIARQLQVKKDYAIASGCLFFLTPIVIAQAITNYVDLMFGAMFLVFFYFYLKYINSKRIAYVGLAGLAAGVTLGIKSSAAAYIGVCVIVVFIDLMIRLWKKEIVLQEIGKIISIFVIPTILVGGFWYFRTWIIYGNPLYPFTVKLGEWVMFEGRGSMKDMIMVANTPPEIRELEWWKQLLYSWKHIFIKPSYDQGLGGLGIFWTFMAFPSLIITTIYMWIKERKNFWCVFLPVIIIFLIQPSNWWSRYTLYIVAFGSCAFVYILSKITHKMVKYIIIIFTLLCVMMMSYLGYDHIFYNMPYVEQVLTWPKETRTLGNTLRQEYRWADSVPEGSIIASTSLNPFMYPLFGKEYTNKVIPISTELLTKEEYLDMLHDNQVDYIFVRADEIYTDWLQNNLEYKEIESVWEYKVYQRGR